MHNDNTAPDNPVVCEAEESFMCSLALNTTSFVTMVTVSIADARAQPVPLRVPARPGKKRILFVSHSVLYIIEQNIETQVITV